MDELFEEFLALSTQLRSGYLKSIGEKNDSWIDLFHEISDDIPELFRVIYSKVSGTKRGIREQALMDFVPGYRLIHICELGEESAGLNEMYHDKAQTVIPFLANYSSDYICYCRTNLGNEYIGAISHDNPEMELMHETVRKFFETICAFYKRNVYFLDSDGYLDYDMESEGEVGAEINSDIPYWME